MPYTEHGSTGLKQMIHIDSDTKNIYLQEAHRQKNSHTANKVRIYDCGARRIKLGIWCDMWCIS